MAIYLILVCFILLIGYWNTSVSIGDVKTGRFCSAEDVRFLLWFILLTFVSGMRSISVGTDTKGYIRSFYIHNGIVFGFTNEERLFAEFCRLIGRFTTNPQWLIFMSAAVTSFGILRFIRHNSKNCTVSVFLYVALYFYFFSMNGLRQFLGMALVLCATIYAEQRRLVPFLLLVAIATGLHTASIIGIVFWYIYYPNITGKRFLLLVLSAVFGVFFYEMLLVFLSKLFPVYFERYVLGNDTYQGIMIPIVYTFIFLFGAFVAYGDRSWRRDKKNIYILCNSCISAILSVVPIFIKGIDANITERIAWVFQMYAIILIPNALCSAIFKKYRLLYYALCIIMCTVYMVYNLRLGWHRVVPYNFCFFGG